MFYSHARQITINLGANLGSYIMKKLKKPFYITFALSMLMATPVMADTGTVRWFNKMKGYGFIDPDNGGAAVFVHINALEKSGLATLNEEEKVKYDLVEKNGKVAAENIQVLK